MTTGWLDRLRNRQRDQQTAMRLIREAADAEERERFADHDAFVEPSRLIRDGLLVGMGRSSTGEAAPIRLSWGTEYAHWLVQGAPGTGKTTWIASIQEQELRAGRPFGVIDCKGDLFEASLRWTFALAQSTDVVRKPVVVNPFSEWLVPLNVCRPLPGVSAEVQAFEVTLALSRLFDSALGLHMGNIMRHLVLLLIDAELSLVEAPLILQDEIVRGILANRSANASVKEFFLGAYAAVPQASKDALLSRLQALLLSENLRLMLGANDFLDLRGVLDRGDPLVVFFGKGPAVPEEQVEVLGSLFLQLLLQAVYSRGTNSGRPYLLAVDEFFHLLAAAGLARRVETALATTRSFGLSLILIHHAFAQLPTALREIVLGNCDLMALFRTSGRNAAFFGDFMPEGLPSDRARGGQARGRELEALQRLPDRHAFWYDRRKPYRAVRLRVPDLPAPHERLGVKASELERLMRRDAWQQGSAAIARDELRAALRAREQRLRELIRPPVRNAATPKPAERSPRSSAKGRPPRLG